jgi:multidrug efflux system outer membrane protein
LRFDNGYTSYIEVLDPERSLFNAGFSLAQTKEVLFQALVNLYKATGGGWVLEADHLTGTRMGVKIYTHGSEVLHANE